MAWGGLPAAWLRAAPQRLGAARMPSNELHAAARASGAASSALRLRQSQASPSPVRSGFRTQGGVALLVAAQRIGSDRPRVRQAAV